MTRPLLIISASGLAAETIDAVRASGQRQVRGVLDDDPSKHGASLMGVPVLGGISLVTAHTDCDVVVCAGKGRDRLTLAARLADLAVSSSRFASVVHPTVAVPPSCRVGVGSVVLAGAVLTANVRLGEHVVVMPGCVLTHDDRVEPFATLCAGVLLGGGVVVGASAYLGMGAGIRERVRIGRGAVVGMGAVVLQDIPEGEVWAGVPARRVRQ